MTTAFLTSLSAPRKAWAVSFILMRTMELISSALNTFCSPLYWTAGQQSQADTRSVRCS